MQRLAGRAEYTRAKAAAGPHDASELARLSDAARTSRETAVATGEELARARLRYSDETRSGKALAARWEELHERSARRLLDLCIGNGGVYVKLGQHLAQLDYIVPEPYTRTLSALFEHNAPSPMAAIAMVVQESLGRSVDDAFESFDPEPIASASLAQVHRAVERGTGRLLAVKVQHPRLREASAADLAAVAVAVRVAERLFPDDFKLGWILDELAPHLPLELDFTHEAANLERCRAFFAPGGGGAALGDAIALPHVYSHLSSTRVLTMSWEEGERITSVQGLHANGLSPTAVTRLLSECFGALIFRAGFCHCDPHPGNLLIRPRPSDPTQPQLVLLDHGLYRALPTRFSVLYAKLWLAILLGDADGIRKVSHTLGVGDYYPLLAAMLTGRPWADVLSSSSAKRLSERGTKSDKAQIAGYAQQYLKEIVHVLSCVPPPMLLLFKCQDCLRHVERQLLGTVGLTSFSVTLRYCLVALANEQLESDDGAGGRPGMSARLRRLRLRLAVWLMQACARSGLFELGPKVAQALG